MDELKVNLDCSVLHNFHHHTFVVGFLDILVESLLVFKAWGNLF